MARPRVKICCIKSPAEARTALAHGADVLGLVSHMPSGPGVIPEELIAEIAASVPPGTATFLLTALTEPEAIIAQHRRCRTSTIQLVDAVAPGTHAVLRRALPAVHLVQVVHVTGEGAVAEAAAVAPHVDFILLDSGNPSLAVKELGGTGRTHDWAVSRRIVATCGRPVYLAGGLRPDNLAAAHAQVGPYGFDLCNSVRTADVLDEAKLAAFFAAVRMLE